MTFLQLGFLFALPLALLPVIIHLLNRLRYRTVKWAAMLFLVQASRSSTRRSKLRHYLILASRCLLLAFFLFALARPMVGGWLGSQLSGKPDLVLLLLDRSASMERLDPRHQATRRAHALSLFADGAKQVGPEPRYVLIDSASLQPQEVGDVAALPGLAAAAPTDTAADAAGLVQAAVDYLTRNPAGKSEIWLASDLQAANWRPDSPRWSRLGASLSALAGDHRLRLLDLSGAPGENMSLSLLDVKRAGKGRDEHLLLTLRVRRADAAGRTLPVTVELGGARTQTELAITGADARLQHKLPLPTGAASGWGRLELPADANLRDNTAWFVFGPAHRTPALVSVGSPASARLVRLSAAPDGKLREAVAVSEAALSAQALDEAALVAWQPGAGSEAVAERLEAFVAQGGTVLLLPPDPALPATGAGLSWKSAEDAPAGKPFGVTFWEEEDGPFAKTGNGVSLPLAAVTCARRRVPLPTGAEAEGDSRWSVLASFGDQQPFALLRRSGRGVWVALATLPEEAWSNLGNGRVLVPLVQRLLAEGGKRLAPGRLDVAGEWKPAAAGDLWAPADGATERDWARLAGSYRNGDRWVALNRPDTEDEPEQLEPARAAALFGDFPNVSVAADLGTRSTGGDQGEIWRSLVVAALLFLLLESLLLAGLLTHHRPATASLPVRRKEAA